MKKNGLSIIIQSYSAKDWIVPMIDHIVDALTSTNFDDSSSDNGAAAAHSAKVQKGILIKVAGQVSTGRHLARKLAKT